MDFTKAEKIFSDYVKQYDPSDDKIRLKIVHTYGVVDAAEAIAHGLALSKTDIDLARHIALLHDIGRFEQLRQFHSFDDSVIPHASLSLSILFGEETQEPGARMINRFLPEREYDSIIYTAIKNHGLYRLEPGLSGKMLLHSQLIRDADKLDNFRVKEQDSIVTMLDVSAQELGAEPISRHVYEKFLNRVPVLNSERRTHMDMWVSYLGYIFDLNFSVSRKLVTERGYIDRLIDRVPYSNDETKNQMEAIRRTANMYLDEP